MMELVPYSARGDRLISRFHAEEMLYEYVQGTLDPIRAEGVKNIIDHDPKLKLEMEAIRRALAYCDTLSRIEFTPARIDEIRTETSAMDQFLKRTRIHEWPGGIRVGLESLFVISLVFFFAMMVPWNTLISVLQENQGTVVLSEVTKESNPEKIGSDLPMLAQKTTAPLPENQQAATAAMANDKFEDEGVPQEEIAQSQKQLESLTEVLKEQKMDPGPLKTVQPPAPAVEKKAEVNIAPGTSREPAQAPSVSAHKGWLNKGRLTLTNVQAVTPKIVELVTSLGGRKAGQVNLGWAKGTGSYFHFTIPEAKYVELENALKNYGKLSLVREAHVRVMPEGIVRVIIDVEEAAPGIKKEPEFIPEPVRESDGSTPSGATESSADE